MLILKKNNYFLEAIVGPYTTVKYHSKESYLFLIQIVIEKSKIIVLRIINKSSLIPIIIPPELPTDGLKNHAVSDELTKLRVLSGKDSSLVSCMPKMSILLSTIYSFKSLLRLARPNPLQFQHKTFTIKKLKLFLK
jgi:hypothetical protein